MFNVDQIINTKSYNNIKTVSQSEYYVRNGAGPEILKLVNLSAKGFGETIQKIIKELLNLQNPTNTGHDAQKNSKKFEIKSARRWTGTGDWKWQHIMLDHDYDYLIFCGLDFHDLKIYTISKPDLIKHPDVKQQGNAEGQGLWCDFNKIKSILTEINSEQELINFIN